MKKKTTAKKKKVTNKPKKEKVIQILQIEITYSIIDVPENYFSLTSNTMKK